MTPLQILKDARALIAPYERWCRGQSAHDRAGKDCPARSQEATCWCASGAIDRTWNGPRLGSEVATVNRAYMAMNDAVGVLHPDLGLSFIGINDRFGHEAILKVFDHAITQLEREAVPA